MSLEWVSAGAAPLWTSWSLLQATLAATSMTQLHLRRCIVGNVGARFWRGRRIFISKLNYCGQPHLHRHSPPALQCLGCSSRGKISDNHLYKCDVPAPSLTTDHQSEVNTGVCQTLSLRWNDNNFFLQKKLFPIYHLLSRSKLAGIY